LLIADQPLSMRSSGIPALARQVHLSLQRYSSDVQPSKAQLSSLLAETSLDGCEPLLRRLPSSLFDAASGDGASAHAPASLVAFVDEVAALASENPLLCQLSWRVRCEAAASGELDDEVYRLVHYCLLLHLVTAVLAQEPEVADQVYIHMRQAVRSRPGWDGALNWFEVAKLTTMDITLERFAEHRLRGRPLPPNFGHFGLPFNILEAVLQDARRGWLHNAAAGLALSASRPGNAGASAVSTDHRRAVQMWLPRPTEWKHMYVSWNMCFTTAYADSPYFAAAILAPCVLGAQPHEFIFHRALALHLHISTAIRQRHVLNRPSLREPILSRHDWRHAGLSRAWGDLNCDEAMRYERRLRLTPHARSLARVVRRRRRGFEHAWQRQLSATSIWAGHATAVAMAALAVTAGATVSG
jgi:hypothetical protein